MILCGGIGLGLTLIPHMIALIMTLPKYEASRNSVYRKYKNRAKIKGYTFDITKEDFTRICENDCHYCGAERVISHSHKKLNGLWKRNGLDRIDNSKGYLLSNVQACCYRCNRLKSNKDEKEFLSQITRISLHLGLVSIMEDND